MIGSSSGTAMAMSSRKSSTSARSSMAQAVELISVTCPSESRPTMPALTPSSTASVNWRRFSLVSDAWTSARRCCLSCRVIRLNCMLRSCRSPVFSVIGTSTLRSPVDMRLAAIIRLRIGETKRLASAMPSQSAASSKNESDAEIHQGEGDLEDQPIGGVLPVFGDRLVRQAHVFEHFRIDGPGDEQIGVVIALQLHHRTDEIG